MSIFAANNEAMKIGSTWMRELSLLMEHIARDKDMHLRWAQTEEKTIFFDDVLSESERNACYSLTQTPELFTALQDVFERTMDQRLEGRDA